MVEGAADRDRLARTVARALGASIGILAVVARSSVEVASHGATDPGAAGPGAGDLAAVDGVTLVPDLVADPRFAGGCWARLAPGARSLALAPVEDAGGARLGVVAVLGAEPRAWTAAEGELLEDLAVAAAHTLGEERLIEEVTELRRTDTLFRAMMEHFPNGSVSMFDRDLRFTLGGGRAAHLTPADVVGKTVREVFGDEQGSVLEASYREVLAGKQVFAELPLGGLTFLVHRLPIPNAAGEIVAGLVVAQDITRRVEAEHAVRESEERYRLLFEKAGEAIFISDEEPESLGTILDVNDAGLRMHGFARDELLAKKSRDLLAPDQGALADGARRRILDGDWVRVSMLQMLRKDGSRFPVEVTSGPIEIDGKRRLISFVYDVTERVKADEALREARAAADAANRAKSTFLANMSHEIRTPMNAIVGYAQLLQRERALGEEHRRQVGIIQRAGDHLLELINDVLEMSKIEAGHRSLNRGIVNTTAMLGEVERMFLLRARAKGLVLTVGVDPGVPRHISGDEGRLRQVLMNLIGNAVKFTARGAVTVRATYARDAATLAVEVDDTGPGIEPEMLGVLFKPFSQARAGLAAQGGTGLGLAISREYARMMGGEITVESRPGEGSVFRFAIPCEAALAPAPEATAPAGRIVGIEGAGERPRILIVDDDEDSRSWLRLLLTQLGFEVREAENGAVGLAMFSAWRPPLVLLDVNMPVLDGFDTMKAIRALSYGARTAIVAVTASAFDDQRDAILAAGADAVLRKPCREGELLAEIGRRLGLTYRRAVDPRDVEAATPGVDALPPDLTAALREAVLAADYEHLTDLIAALPAEHAATATALRAMAERYAYEEIDAMLRA
jgi:PAS domain S-box-containing protein